MKICCATFGADPRETTPGPAEGLSHGACPGRQRHRFRIRHWEAGSKYQERTVACLVSGSSEAVGWYERGAVPALSGTLAEAMRVLVAGDRGYIGAVCTPARAAGHKVLSSRFLRLRRIRELLSVGLLDDMLTARPVDNFPRRAPAPRKSAASALASGTRCVTVTPQGGTRGS